MPPTPQQENADGPDLLLHWNQTSLGRRRWRESALGTAAIHLALVVALVTMPLWTSGPDLQWPRDTGIVVAVSLPLIAPTPEAIAAALGQPEPPVPAKPDDTPEVVAPASPAAPAVVTRPVRNRRPPALVEPPPIQPPEPAVVHQSTPAGAISSQPEEPAAPEIAVEAPSATASDGAPAPPAASGNVAPPHSVLSEIARDMLAAQARPGVAINDNIRGAGPDDPLRGGARSSRRTNSSFQVLSDTNGFDVTPYLNEVLTQVRAHWQQVIPVDESMDRYGVVSIQFAIARDGAIPKLVIASSSGRDPLDQAAVAAVSSSEPLPRLPAGLEAAELRVQFNFVYERR